MGFSPQLFVSGPRYSVGEREVCGLLNVIFGTAKLAIWKTRRNQIRGDGAVDAMNMTRGLLAARLRVEFEFYKLTNDLVTYLGVWGVNGVLCSVREGFLEVAF